MVAMRRRLGDTGASEKTEHRRAGESVRPRWARAAAPPGFAEPVARAVIPRHRGRMPQLGKMLVVLGLVITAVGVLLWTGVGRSWLGRLPGDIHVNRDNFSFHFPVVTCLVISAVLSLLLWLFRR